MPPPLERELLERALLVRALLDRDAVERDAVERVPPLARELVERVPRDEDPLREDEPPERRVPPLRDDEPDPEPDELDPLLLAWGNFFSSLQCDCDHGDTTCCLRHIGSVASD